MIVNINLAHGAFSNTRYKPPKLRADAEMKVARRNIYTETHTGSKKSMHEINVFLNVFEKAAFFPLVTFQVRTDINLYKYANIGSLQMIY